MSSFMGPLSTSMRDLVWTKSLLAFLRAPKGLMRCCLIFWIGGDHDLWSTWWLVPVNHCPGLGWPDVPVLSTMSERLFALVLRNAHQSKNWKKVLVYPTVFFFGFIFDFAPVSRLLLDNSPAPLLDSTSCIYPSTSNYISLHIQGWVELQWTTTIMTFLKVRNPESLSHMFCQF